MEYLKKNYHTHTERCNHAQGSEREFVEKAIECRMEVFGFADHTFHLYRDPDYVSTIRMKLEEAGNYADTIHSLNDEYRSVIHVPLGIEVEYYPEEFGDLLDFSENLGVDYMILGQHYTKNEYDGTYVGRRCDETVLGNYTESVLEAIGTGMFSYIAHPDLCRFNGDDDIYRKYMSEICKAAKKASLPLEINLLGVWEDRHYPSDRFFSLAAEYGNDVIYGIDAHVVEAIGDEAVYKKAEEFRNKYGLKLVDCIDYKIRHRK